ncbi:MAG: SpoIID/LytB domain-containing protein [Spirochaetes bacterium]|nr:SpoIID/LytB domain-containing protein [Spirochaetota bacterium]
MSFSISKAAFFCAALILAGFSSCTPSEKFLIKQNIHSAGSKIYIRVLLEVTDSRVLISSESRMKITDQKSQEILYNGKGKSIYFQPDKVSSPVQIESWGSPLSVDKVPYRGMIEVHNILGKINIINVIKINEYLYSVVAGEIISTWPDEALKAQAVAARTYTYHHLLKRNGAIYDLDNTNNFQVYKGISVEKESTTNAVNATVDKIACENNKPIVAFFHSACGGITADDKDVWTGDNKCYLRPVKCNYCRESPYYSWEENLSLYEIRECLNKEYRGIGRITGIRFQRKDNRVSAAVISHTNGVLNLTGNEFRLLFPVKKIKSMFFLAKKTNNGLKLKGHGWGHGVGMCQWGAKGMAEKGADYIEILKYYYKGIQIINAGPEEYAGK